MRSGDIAELTMEGITELTMAGITECIMERTMAVQLPYRATRAITRAAWDMGLVTKCGGPCITIRRT